MLSEESVAVLVANGAEEDNATVASVGDDDIGAGDRSRNDSAGEEELVPAAPAASERLEASLLTDATEDLQTVAVAFRHNDVARLGVNELRVVDETATVARRSPFVLRAKQKHVYD